MRMALLSKTIACLKSIGVSMGTSVNFSQKRHAITFSFFGFYQSRHQSGQMIWSSTLEVVKRAFYAFNFTEKKNLRSVGKAQA